MHIEEHEMKQWNKTIAKAVDVSMRINVSVWKMN
jgi:hypothetical protein